jgi:predicted transcriptional regulator YdeE
MSEIQKLEIHAKKILGLSLRTQKIAPLWKRFNREILPILEEGTAVYAVYHNYESDVLGEYDLLIGTENFSTKNEVHSVILEEGRYLMFPVKGELPQALITTWQEIWHYFQDPSVDERRDFKTDFECYKSQNEVEIYIGVNYF